MTCLNVYIACAMHRDKGKFGNREMRERMPRTTGQLNDQGEKMSYQGINADKTGAGENDCKL